MSLYLLHTQEVKSNQREQVLHISREGLRTTLDLDSSESLTAVVLYSVVTRGFREQCLRTQALVPDALNLTAAFRTRYLYCFCNVSGKKSSPVFELYYM